MEYYKNYQNLNEILPQTASTNVIGNPQANVTNLLDYQSYQSSDPRLNYAQYNTIPAPACYDLLTPTYDLSLPKPTLNPPTKSDDELWIETWLSRIGKIQINLNSTVEITAANVQKKTKPDPKPCMQLHVAKSLLKDCLHVIENLQTMQEFLKTNAATMSSSNWRKNTLEIGSVKNEFSRLFAQFENPDTIARLRKTVEKRRKKRVRHKRRKKHRQEILNEIREERRRANKEIDQWLENMKEKVERVKMEENMKKNADLVLAEVTKKKSDARKNLSLITSLAKLRNVREQTAVQRGEKVSTEDGAAFTKVTDRLSKIWTNALQVYAKEEQCLQIMLEQNATDDTNAARAAKEIKTTQEWETVFFGLKCIPSPIYRGLTAADKDLETFIAIRKSWDTFLTTSSDENGSKIPIGWVTPNPHAHESWTKYLEPL